MLETVVREAVAEKDPVARQRDLSGEIERLVARRFRVSRGALQAPGRCGEAESLARHVAMYLERVVLGHGYREIARRFMRHPTTVIYACRRVEDLRDDPAFDSRIGAIEQTVTARAGDGRA